MDDGKVDHPAPIIPLPHSINDTNPKPAYYKYINIPTAVLASHVNVIDKSVGIPITVGFHNRFLLEICLKSPPKFDSNIIIDDICKDMFHPDECRKDKI